jgi:DNA-binding transcriptional ArsR family regulator
MKTEVSARVTMDRREHVTKIRLVKIIEDSEGAKLISDPMRRAILNLLRLNAMSQSELADSLGLTDGTVNYHLRLLRKNGFLTVARTEVEEHGILQKFYAPTAFLYLPDVESLPMEVARYYYPINIERIRGVLSSGHGKVAQLSLTGRDVDELGEELAKELVKVAGKYRELEINQGEGESLVRKIYTEALFRLARKK